MNLNQLMPSLALSFRFASRRILGLALLAALIALLAVAPAQAQNTQVTIEGTITTVVSLPGVIVGDRYSMVVYYNPTQTPASTSGSTAYYTGFTLNAVVDDKDGNQSFSAEAGEELAVNDASGSNSFASPPCCSSSTAAGFGLADTTGTAFKTNALPTALLLKDFGTAFTVFGNTDSGGGAQGSITSIRVLDTDGIVPVFIVAGTPDPNGKVPGFNAVPGSGVANLDIAVPLSALAHGSSYEFTIALFDVNFTGSCQASYTLTQIQYNKTVTLDSGKDGTFSPTPGSYWAYAFASKAIPDYPGPATLTGIVTCGTVKETTSSTVVIQ